MSNKIKEVNGIKIVKRYSTGSIFSGLICFFYPIIAILFLVLPWMIMNVTPEGSTETVTTNVRMLDTILTVVLQPNVFADEFMPSIAGYGPTFLFILNILTVAVFALWVFLVVFALFELFYGLMYLFRGKVTHYKVPATLSIFASICIIGIAVLAFVQFILFTVMPSEPKTTVVADIYWLIIYVVVAVLGTILLIIIYNLAFKNKVFIGDLGDLSHLTGDAELDEKGQIKYITKEVVKVKYEPAIGLPPKLSSIGGHAFSQNMNLVVAMIPNGIKVIGQGAFANCGRLKIVSIPLSVKSIQFNAFFNCANLQRINYAGTKEQWRHVKRGSNWLTKAGTYTVVCADGAIIVNPYH